MATNSRPHFTFDVVNASSRERGIQRARLAADKHFFPKHLYTMVEEKLVRTDSARLNYTTWSGPVRFKALSYEAVDLPQSA